MRKITYRRDLECLTFKKTSQTGKVQKQTHELNTAMTATRKRNALGKLMKESNIINVEKKYNQIETNQNPQFKI